MQNVATDAAGNAFVVGYFSGNITIGSTTLVSAGLNDVFIAKMAPNGTLANNSRALRAQSNLCRLETVVEISESGGRFTLAINVRVVSYWVARRGAPR